MRGHRKPMAKRVSVAEEFRSNKTINLLRDFVHQSSWEESTMSYDDGTEVEYNLLSHICGKDVSETTS